MDEKANINYDRIAQAIDYIRTHIQQQPTLDDMAQAAALSPAHFQRLFTDWAGVSPKKFLQYLTLSHAKELLASSSESLQNISYSVGLSGSSRLYDLFVNIEGMTPGEYKNGGQELSIRYSYQASPFGTILVASTSKGICFMEFADDREDTLVSLQQAYPNAHYIQESVQMHSDALCIFQKDWSTPHEIKLHLKGTPFQLKVWETLLKIQPGQLTTYSKLASLIDNPKASRAVGSAVAKNPIACIIPCHRVIRSTGDIGQYHWGSTRKAAIIGWEGCDA